MSWIIGIAAVLIFWVYAKSRRISDAHRDAGRLPANPSNAHFVARHEAESKGWFGGAKRIRIGYWDKSCTTPLYYNGKAHLFLIAPARSGKARDLLIAALEEYLGSVIVIDPKGQLAAVTGPWRKKMGQRVFVLNPFKILSDYLGGLIHAGFNPLAVLDPNSESFGADCDSLAEAIVYAEGESERFFVDSARQLISGVIAMIVAYAAPESRNLTRLAEIVTGAHFFEFCRKADSTGHMEIKTRLSRFAASRADEDRTIMAVVETARTAVGFISNAAIANSLRAVGPQLRFADLRQVPTTVYLVLPARYLATCAKWFRLVIAAAMADLLREDNRGPVRVLGILDEFAQLGALKVMSDVMGLGAGYGIQVLPVLQSLIQLQVLYKDWSTFLSGAGAQIYFSPRQGDLITAEHISKSAGETEVMAKGGSVSTDMGNQTGKSSGGSIGGGYSIQRRPLIYPHETYAVSSSEMLIFGEDFGNGVIRAGRRPYYEMPECAGKFSPDPYETGK